jgi:hypothetical protein
MKIYAKKQCYVRGENAEELTKATGESGDGYYFSPESNHGMVEYYCQNSKHVWIACPKNGCQIADLTSTEHVYKIIELANKNVQRLQKEMAGYIAPKINIGNIQRFPYAIEEYIRENLQNIDAYLTNHKADGTNLPSGKQLIILNLDAFSLEQKR